MTWFVRHNGEQLLAIVILHLPAIVAGKLCNNVKIVKMKITAGEDNCWRILRRPRAMTLPPSPLLLGPFIKDVPNIFGI